MKYMNQGDPVELAEMLDAREMRAAQLDELAVLYPKDTILSFKLNIPGPIKNNEMIARIFDDGVEKIKEVLAHPVICSLTNDKTGPELILRTGKDARALKEKMIRLEEAAPIARLYDIDVLFRSVAVSRETLGRGERPCFICSRPAKVCARSRAHSVDEMLEKIEQLILENPRLNS